MNRRMRDTLLGILLGFIGDVIGFVLYGLVFSWMNGVSFGYFYQNIFLDNELRSQILTGALIVNILMFYILMRRRMDDLNKGVLIAILLTVIGIVYYYT